VHASVLSLELDSLAMDLSGKGMRRRLSLMRRRRRGVRGLLCLAFGGLLMRQCSGLAFTRTLLARSSRVGVVLIVHTCRVPSVGISNQPG
jgi:hypothetical protein